MKEITEFYAKAISNGDTKTKLEKILGGKNINEADDEQLKKIGELAKELGYEITVEEAKEYLNSDNAELDDDDLDAVAGGSDKHQSNSGGDGSIICNQGGGHTTVTVSGK